MLTITNKAKRALLERGGADGFIRVVVQAGGCAGMTYHAEIVRDRKEEEKLVWRDDHLQVITDDESLPYLIGLTIDYSEDLITAGFRFTAPNSKSSCGCGASFAASGKPLFIDEGGGCGL